MLCAQVLDDVRYDKIAAVRATAAAAWAEFNSLLDPPAADDATPSGKSDKAGSSSKMHGKASHGGAKVTPAGAALQGTRCVVQRCSQ